MPCAPVIYATVPAAFMDTPMGLTTGIVVTSFSSYVLITATSLLAESVTYANPEGVGKAVMVAVTGLLPVLVAVKEGIFPDPQAVKPIKGPFTDQLYWQAIPGKTTGAVVLPFVTV